MHKYVCKYVYAHFVLKRKHEGAGVENKPLLFNKLKLLTSY